jgi:hypothetical protein
MEFRSLPHWLSWDRTMGGASGQSFSDPTIRRSQEGDGPASRHRPGPPATGALIGRRIPLNFPAAGETAAAWDAS